MVEHLTTETFKEKVFNYDNSKNWKYEGTMPCVIDFYADWCGPCKQVAPLLEELSEEYDGKVNIYKVDADTYAEIAMLFNIRSIPTILFIPVGDKKPQISVGALPKSSLKKAIEEIL